MPLLNYLKYNYFRICYYWKILTSLTQSNSDLHWAAAHQPIIDYFPITAWTSCCTAYFENISNIWCTQILMSLNLYIATNRPFISSIFTMCVISHIFSYDSIHANSFEFVNLKYCCLSIHLENKLHVWEIVCFCYFLISSCPD